MDTPISKYLQGIFEHIHNNGIWNNNNPNIPKSGPGSSLVEVLPFIFKLKEIFTKYSIKSMLDFGCGDLSWIPMIDEFTNKSVKYYGIDLIKSLIDTHAEQYNWGTFKHADVRICDLPNSDLFLCKDIFSHLDDIHINDIFENILRSEFKYILVSNIECSIQDRIFSEPWHWRKLNLLLPPFSLRIYTEKFSVGKLNFILISKSQLTECLSSLAPNLKEMSGNIVYYDGPFINTNNLQPSGDPKIPRMLHMIWIGSKPIPWYVYEYQKKWTILMPNWTIRLWTNQDLSTIEFPNSVLQKINTCSKGAQKADLLRAFIILKYGGAYFDCDHEPLQSIEPLWQKLYWATAIGCHYESFNPAYIANGFFAACAAHPWLAAVCTDIMNQPLNTIDVNWKTGPGAYGRCLTSSMDIVIVPPHFFYPYHYKAKFQPWNKDTSYSVHHWFHDW